MSNARHDHKLNEHDTATDAPKEPTVDRRRLLLGGAAGGLVLAASGLFLPDWLQETEAREGSLGGAKGGRRGKDRKGRHKKRTHGDKKDRDGAPPQKQCVGIICARDTALTVRSIGHVKCDFYYRVRTGIDDYGDWINTKTETLTTSQLRYAPDKYRIGVLVTPVNPMSKQQVFVDVRNNAFGFPVGSVTRGDGPLDPSHNNYGNTTVIGDTRYYVDEYHEGTCYAFLSAGATYVSLQRVKDSDDNIEFILDFHSVKQT